MTREEFNQGFAALANAFPNSDRSIEATQEIYWQMLQEIPAEIWAEGIKDCLREKTFFPTIHEIGVACYGETKEHDEQRCDPYRYKQNYVEHIEAISWTQNMAREQEIKRLGYDPAKLSSFDSRRLRGPRPESDKIPDAVRQLISGIGEA